ncbi:MAG TPA: DUF2911 domain-containing protein [Flavobacteriaceae bacterium]|nr:DUF2911 domain-containing protein [Flavobacteriaceae bacterium]
MKKILLLSAGFLVGTLFSAAQVQTPQSSPHVKVTQTIGLTEVNIDYSRPSVKEREIFGELVPFEEIWRTGANQNTTISFSDDVVINGKSLSAGTYSIFTKPGKEAWEVYFYKDIENWGVPRDWDESKIALETEAKAVQIPVKMESFTIFFDHLKDNSADLVFIWENTVVSVNVEVPTEEKAMESIKNTMSGEPTVNDYFAASSYYLSQEKDLKQALEWMNKGIKMNKKEPPFYILLQKAKIQAKLGMKKEAIKTSQKSLEGAKKADNAHYISENQKLLKELGA